LVYNWTFFETNIHSRSYSHIIRNIYNVPKEMFNGQLDAQVKARPQRVQVWPPPTSACRS
jgi:ribonucleotide reductase beta subunit family protein with ferritin-like domain